MTKNFLSRIPLRQIPELDSIRFLSILLVVLHHQFFQGNPVLTWFSTHGWVGVDIFFVMSGFLITKLLLSELDRSGTINLKSFWFRRMLRLWPSWIFTLGLSFIMVYGLSSGQPEVRSHLYERWWHYLAHFGNYSYVFSGKIHTLYSHFWSLAVEEHFYVFWPLLLVFLRSRTAAVKSILFLIAASICLRFWHFSRGDSEQLVSFSTHTRMDELLFGCLLSIYFPKISELSTRVEIFLTSAMFGLFLLGLYILKGNAESPLLASLTYTVIGLATCLLIVISLKGNSRGLRRVFQIPLLAKLGVLSYGVYLIHLHVNYIVFPLLKKFPITQDQSLIACINLIIPFFVAYGMYFAIDEKFSKLKNLHVGLAVPVPAPAQSET